MSPTELNEYVHLVLTPVAMAWREQFPKKKQTICTMKTPYSCRIKFVDDREVEKAWQAFCRTHGIKNEETLEV
ncbi:hypothetical protein pEaSNUABM40_00259 [Erwinia phage pEa_SNUABM_40]|uniref:Uncharacterized protein n=1 Tax=Erwinia phage pEa_SNUABM_3 TaxID=2869552 RepID=A0AAE7XLD9_9CAUD|nr:endonuclease [Erwinia phage pEa_SNUABM_3]QZE56791.1 hypothetical protein pEaSNUABM20_00255 [Erwinia phage pEa_SNUABM_20]QZE58475.1 hypothetical protein pEaSNUABM40_00259 [Erwinia phage pEa_SNUABM_40]UAW53036.1 hypothetical protein pEaSNUABM23_00254 [Erwinia phage pEa_SNUABM_23]UIW10931.1 hypothetical protein pEaSNUABM23_00254 [Erwinia phage pEa_SNUABM_31]QZE56453.1 hypothetical protein pEaSNUABM3_00256 [Erwinia phage pEa_SNUABM_3]